jgi:HEPN superfamily Swt1-like protein
MIVVALLSSAPTVNVRSDFVGANAIGGFIEFGHLSQIIVEKWQLFEDIVPCQHWLKQRMDELERTRHFIAHNRALLPSEYQRVYMYIADWNRVVSL